MKKIFLLFGIIFTGCVTKQVKEKEISSADTFQYDFSPIEEKIKNWIECHYYPGASIVVVKDNEVLYEEYFGNYTRETQVYVASAGKWLAAAAIAAVVDEGKLGWDDKVVQWLPEFKDIKGQATLRQLLSHTSGYPDYQPTGSRRDDYQSLEESVKHIVNLPADTTPGTEFHYGGLAMQVAGRMAELATGNDWETIFQKKIGVPLEMTGTRFTPVDSTGGHNPMIGGGARCTLHDYVHFLQMISNDGVYNNERILSRKSISEMQRDQVNGALVHAGEYVQRSRAAAHGSIYGLGEWREILNDQGDAVMISSPGWAGAYPWIDKENNVYGFFLTHVNVEKANRDGFSSFYASAKIPMMVRDILPGVKQNETQKNLSGIGRAELCYDVRRHALPVCRSFSAGRGK
jgi:CubicO group peptidase (beta-lactamase class C family)